MEHPDAPHQPDALKHVEALFVAALPLSPAQRAALLDEACADAPGVRAEVASLLAAYDQADDFLDAIDADQAVALLQTAGKAVTGGQHIGPYRVLRELGRGGMGAVYLAERADGHFEQQVALKLIKRGMDTDAILHRFLTERQILARLHHPHIARLYDGGVTDDGQPYFAMEYIDGLPINQYCDAHQLGVEERLGLFLDACRAVQYAHGNLVVHRDLKPSNILVTPEGGLKLLDFGIAKLLDDEVGATVLTQEGFRAMTPEYAAPEQVRGETITTATDVYALGVVLYELLTGHRPYAFERRTPDAMMQMICGTEPDLPSTMVQRIEKIAHPDGTTETLTPEDVSQARSTQPDRLKRRLAGDLDTIVLMALRKESGRRYASAEGFLEDIKRHLAGLPVTARKDTLGYRAATFIRRHSVGVAAVALVVVSLALGLLSTAWQAHETARQAAKAEEVKDFVISLFEVADPDESRGETITARELLEEGAARIETELADQPDVQAEMMVVVGEVYRRLGLYDPAQPLLEQALALRQSLYGETHADVVESRHRLAMLLHDKAAYDEAEVLLRQVLAQRQAALGAIHLDVAEARADLGLVLRQKEQFGEAESLYREALAVQRTLLAPDHPEVATSLANIARILHKKGDFGPEPDSLYSQALALHRRHYGALHSEVLETMDQYSLFLQDKGRHGDAERLSREKLRLSIQLYGEEHAEVATSFHNLARLLYIKGATEDAEGYYRKALDGYRNALGPDHLYVAVSLHDLGAVLASQKRYEEAKPLLRESLRLYRAQFGDAHSYVAMNLSRLALVMDRTGNLGEAEALYRDALATYRATLPADHPFIGTVLIDLGALLVRQGQPAEAEPLLRELNRNWEAAFEPTDRRLLDAHLQLGRCLSALERFDEAAALLQTAYAVLRQEPYGDDHTLTKQTRRALARLYTAWGKPQEAAAYRP